MPDESTSASTAEASGAATSAEGEKPPETAATAKPSARQEATTATTASNGTEKSAEQMSEAELRAELRGENPMEREITAAIKRGREDEDFDPTNPFPESDDPLEELLGEKAESGKQKAEPSETETAEGTQETEGTKETTTETEETTETKPGDEPDEDEVVNEDGKTKSKRIRVNLSRLPDRDAAILRLASEKGLSLKDAETRLFGESKPAGTKEPETTKPEPEPTVDEIDGQIDELETAMDAAHLTLDEAKVKELRGKLKVARKAMDAAQARAVEARTLAAAAESERTNSVRQSMARATEIYPDAVNEKSALYADIQAEVTRLEQSDPAFFRNPKWPILVAAGCAAERGIAPTVKATPGNGTKAPEGTKVAAVKPVVKPARQVPAPASGSASVRTVTQQAVDVDPSKMTEKEMRTFLKEHDKSAVAA